MTDNRLSFANKIYIMNYKIYVSLNKHTHIICEKQVVEQYTIAYFQLFLNYIEKMETDNCS